MRKGQALIEAVAAFGIAAVVLVALLRLAGRSIDNSGMANRQAVATNYVSEGMQWVKGQKNISGYGFLISKCPAGVCSNTCFGLGSLAWGSDCTAPNITGTEYSRILILNQPVVGQLTATVRTSWREAGRTVTAKQDFLFTDR